MAKTMRTPPTSANVVATATATTSSTMTTTTTTAASPVSVAVTPYQEPLVNCFSLYNNNNNNNHDDVVVDGTNNHHSQPVSWNTFICPASVKSQRTKNPIRALVDPIAASIQSGQERGDGKDPISLALGDPTGYGNLEPCPLALEAIVQVVQSPPHAASYVNACGTLEARSAIAHYHGITNPDHIIVANGCSGALELALTALLDPNTYLLVPQPGFPLYQVIAESHGAHVIHYRLDPQCQWQVDLDHLTEQIQSVFHQQDQQQHHHVIRAMVVNNPSNPTGSVYSRDHLQDILSICQRYGIPVIADEVYGNLVLDPITTPFWPIASLASSYQVPVITASGLAKQFLLPGWRIGWIVFHDNFYGSLQDVMAGAKRLAQLILGASHVAQSVIPSLLTPSTMEQQSVLQQWKTNLHDTLARQADFLCRELATCPGLEVLVPQGAMYAMIRIKACDSYQPTTNSNSSSSTSNNIVSSCTDMTFCQQLLREENVFVLPGCAFGATESNLVRVVFCAPESILREATLRIKNFCQRHFTATVSENEQQQW